MTTANDVIHAWGVPALGVKQDAIPGFVRDTWFKAEKIGTYRGNCYELCGKEHAFMPIVVNVVSEEDYAKWVADQKKAMAANADDPNRPGLLPNCQPAAKKCMPPTAPPATKPTAKVCRAHFLRWTVHKWSLARKTDKLRFC